MDTECGGKAIVAGTDFGLLITALRDDIPPPTEWPQRIPDAWLDDLDGYEMTAQLSTSGYGPRIVASTEAGYSRLTIIRRDKSHLAVNIPHDATEGLPAGELVLTVELRHRVTGSVLRAERRTLPLIRVRSIEGQRQ